MARRASWSLDEGLEGVWLPTKGRLPNLLGRLQRASLVYEVGTRGHETTWNLKLTR